MHLLNFEFISDFRFDLSICLVFSPLKLGLYVRFFLAPTTQRFKFHRIAGASEVVTRAMEFVVRQY